MPRKSFSENTDMPPSVVVAIPPSTSKGRKSIPSETIVTPAAPATPHTAVAPATPMSTKKTTDSVEQTPAAGLTIPPGAKSVFAQQAGALKTLNVGLDQLELPKASVVKLAKSDIPDSVQLRKEVTTALVKASTVFISYLAAASHDTATSNGLKTISGQNVLDAVRDLDLGDEMRVELNRELQAFRAVTKEKRQSKAGAGKKTADDEATAAATTEPADDGDDDPDASRLTRIGDQDGDAEALVDEDQSRLQGDITANGELEEDDEDVDMEAEESVLSVRSTMKGAPHLQAGPQSMDED